MIDRCSRQLEIEAIASETERSDRFTDRNDGRTERLKRRRDITGGELTYIGRLAIAVPNVKNWERILDEDGQVIKVDYRGISDEYLIKTVVYGERANSLFRIDAAWLKQRMQDSMAAGDDQDYQKAKSKYEQTKAAVIAIKTLGSESLLEEFKTRRRNNFMNDPGLEFEKTIDTVAFSAPADLAETFELVGYTAI